MSIQEVTPGTLLTLGYHEPDALSQLQEFMSNPKTQLIDIRYCARAPWSHIWKRRWKRA